MNNERINASEVFAQVLEIISTAVAQKFESRIAALEEKMQLLVPSPTHKMFNEEEIKTIIQNEMETLIYDNDLVKKSDIDDFVTESTVEDMIEDNKGKQLEEDDVERIVGDLDLVENCDIDDKVRDVLEDFVKEHEFKNAVVSTIAAKLSPIHEVKTNGFSAEVSATEEF
jgi:hypothetical protein